MNKKYNKLVRDYIADIISANGEKPIIRKLEDEEYRKELELKLFEECREVIESSGHNRLEELADVYEIMKALAKLENSTIEEVVLIAKEKSEKRGAFEERIYLESVETKEKDL